MTLTRSFHENQLSKDLERSLDSSAYADISVVCGKKEFKCHKFLLASRSSVFKAMFESNCLEKTMG